MNLITNVVGFLKQDGSVVVRHTTNFIPRYINSCSIATKVPFQSGSHVGADSEGSHANVRGIGRKPMRRSSGILCIEELIVQLPEG